MKNKPNKIKKNPKAVKAAANKSVSKKAKPAKLVKTNTIKKTEKKKIVAKKDKKAELKKAKPIKKEKNLKVKAISKKEAKKEVSKKVPVEKTKKEETIVKKPKPLFANDREPMRINSMTGKPSRPRRRKKKKKKEEDDEPEILHDELVEQLIRQTKNLKKQPKKPKIIRTYTNPKTTLTVVPEINQTKNKVSTTKKEPKGKFTLEYVIRTTPALLYEFVSTAGGFADWFADEATIYLGVFTFVWDGSENKARIVSFKENEYVRLHWIDKLEGTYLEFRIQVDKITGDVSLIITDFLDEGSEMETSKRLWDSQVDELTLILGTY